MQNQSGAERQVSVEQFESRVMLTVFAPDLSFHPPGPFPIPGPFDVMGIIPKSTVSSSAISVSKGRFLVTGFIEQAGDGGDTYEIIARVFADGRLDKSYGHNGKLAFYVGDSISVTAGGILYAYGSSSGLAIQSFTANGKLNEAFGGGDGVAQVSEGFTGGSADATIEHLYPDGSLLLLNEVTVLGDPQRYDFVKTKPDGSPDTSFASKGVLKIRPKGIGNVDAFLTDTGLYFQFDHGFSTTPASGVLMRYSTDGKTLDTSFGTNGTLAIPGFARDFAEQSDGKLLFIVAPNDGTAPVLHRVKTDGSPDVSFGTNGTITLSNSTPSVNGGTANIIVDDQNRITVAANGTLFRFSSTGTLDAYPFNGTAPFGDGPISYDDQGRILVRGPFGSRYGLEPIAQLGQDGIAHVYGTSADDTVTVKAISGGKLRFTMNGETVDLAAAEVKGIRMDLYAGGSNVNAPVDVGITIEAGLGDDFIITGDGDDSIVTDEGSDTLQLGGGNDTVVAGNSDSKTDDLHTMTATGGNKKINVAAGSSNITLPAGNHDIFAEFFSKTNTITIAGGNNKINLIGKDATVNIAAGDNTISSSATGNVSITTGDGNDSFDIASFNTLIHAGGGDDTIKVESGSAKAGPTLFGDAGNDSITTAPSFDGLATMYGGDGNDTLLGGASAQSLYGEGGKDSIDGGAGDDYISAGGGNDIADGEAGNDLIYGGPGDDTLQGNSGNDNLSGQDGRDHIFGGADNDRIYGGASGDYLYTNNGNDRVYGQGGDDRIYADYTQGNDTLYGGSGKDLFVTRDGQKDLVDGEGGTDQATTDRIDRLISIEA